MISELMDVMAVSFVLSLGPHSSDPIFRSSDLTGGWCWIGTVTWMALEIRELQRVGVYIFFSVWYNHIHVCMIVVHIVACTKNMRACIHYTLGYVTLRCVTLHVKHDTRNLHNRFSGVFGASGYSCCSGRVIKSIFQNWQAEHLPKNAMHWWNRHQISIRKLPFFPHPNDHPIRPLEIRWEFFSCMKFLNEDVAWNISKHF